MTSVYMIILALLLVAVPAFNAEYIPPGPRYRCPLGQDNEQSRLLYPCVCEQGTDSGLYIRCENSGLATLSVGLGNLAAMDIPVEELVLKECNIGKLYGPLLHRLKVRILRIEDTPLSTIQGDAFFGVNHTLQDLYILNSKLEAFPKEAFKILGNLTILKIDGHMMEMLDKGIFADSLALGKLERLHLSNGLIKELQVESFQSLRKLKTLDLHGNKLTILKKNQFKGLRDAEVLDISYNNITKLEGSHIADLTKLSWCNVSHNNLAEITRGMFARNAVLRVLHLDHNHIKRLDTNSFRGMRFLRRLYLSDNEISDVGRGTFSSVTRIGTVDLARNKIKKIDYQMFSQLNYVEIIDISDNQITEIQKLSFKDLYLTTINISHNALSKIEVGSFENCANITVFDLSHNNLSRIVPMAFDSTTFATEFQLSYNFFTELNQIPLHNMSGLKILNVSHNEIHSIPRNTFPKLYELHTVDVSHNQLSNIFSAVFQSLFSLRILDLSHNLLDQIKPPTFGTLPTLLELDLSHNQLSDISRGALANLASCRRMDVSHNMLAKIFQMPISLGEINLSYNNISVVPDNVWPSMNALLALDLSYNPLGSGLSSGSFQSLLTLRTLSFEGIGLTEPPWQALSSLSSLQYLYMSKNNLTTLKKAAFGRLPIVFELDMSDNQITSISERAFDGLLQLLKLTLRNNSIAHIPNGAFYGLVSLRTLDLSYNNLEKIENKTNSLLEDCLSLERVNLSHNKISYINRKTFPSDPWIPYKLQEVDLSYNVMPVLTNDIIFGTSKVQVLNVSHNIMNDIRRNVIGNLTSLHVLDLSHNDLNDLTSHKDIFRLPVNITSINLSDNQLQSLPVEHMFNATNLKHLDVRNNELETFDDLLVTRIKKNGLGVLFDGNPLRCDCFTRPLKHHLNHLTKSLLADNLLYTNITCESPAVMKDSKFIDIDDDRLICNDNVGIREKLDKKKSLSKGQTSDYEVEQDLVFRDMKFSQESIFIQWFVQASKDIADFRVIIRNANNEIFYSTDISYNKRQHVIELAENDKLHRAIKEKKSDLELCVLGGNSNSVTSSWFQNQCRKLPDDFSVLRKENFVKSMTSNTFATRNNYNRGYIFSNALIVKSNHLNNFFMIFTTILYYICY